MPYCPECGDEFESWVRVCPDCGVELMDKPPSRPEKQRGREPLVHVATAANEPEACLWAAVLKDNGIRCMVRSAGLQAAYYVFPGDMHHEVYVLASQAERAREILDSIVECDKAPPDGAE